MLLLPHQDLYENTIIVGCVFHGGFEKHFMEAEQFEITVSTVRVFKTVTFKIKERNKKTGRV